MRFCLMALAIMFWVSGCFKTNAMEIVADTTSVGKTDTDSLTDDSSSDSDSESSSSDNTACEDGCLIEGICYSNTKVNEKNSCQGCDVAIASDKWTNLTDKPCDDDVFCNGKEVCKQGNCVNEFVPCDSMTQICWEASQKCCGLDSRRFCDSAGDYYTVDSCELLPELLEDCPSSHSKCTSNGCECEPGWYGKACDKCVLFVDGSLQSYFEHDGASWQTALKTVQEGIDAASKVGCEVWIAKGKYYPFVESGSASDGTQSFVLAENSALYGGFAGGEASIKERDIKTNITELSGDYVGSANINCIHVVTGHTNVRLNGLTISGGAATGDDEAGMGAGVFLAGGSITIENCIFKDNVAKDYGGGLYSINSSLWVHNTEFVSNHCEGELNGWGGAMHLVDSEATIIGGDFVSNYASRGAGLAVVRSVVDVINTIFVDNHAIYLGGGFVTSQGKRLHFYNTIFHSNDSQEEGVVGAISDTDVLFSSCTIAYNGATEKNQHLLNNASGNLQVENSIIWDVAENIPFERVDVLSVQYAIVGQHLFMDTDLIRNDDPRFFSIQPDGLLLACPEVAADCSPAIDVGEAALLPDDEFDLDSDGVVNEKLPVDLLGNARVIGDAIDLGAYEFSQ